jgi:predicted RNase H-like nuclease (RuvC/YqgF family)
MWKQQRYSKEFQGRAVRRMKLGDNVSQLSRELGVHRTCLHRWKRQLVLRPQGRKRAVEEDWRDRRIETLEAKIARVERIVGGQWQELDFFESALRRIEKKDAMTGSGGNRSTPKSVPGCYRKAD